MSRYAIFLGAGASAASGVPLQRDLLATFYGRRAGRQPLESFARGPALFFKLVFGIDVARSEQLPRFPSFEEALGIIDLSLARGEALRGLPLRSLDPSVPSLATIRTDLVLVMADAVRVATPETTPLRQLVDALRVIDKVKETVFLTTNYDTLVDSAIEDSFAASEDAGVESAVDYGFSGPASGAVGSGA